MLMSMTLVEQSCNKHTIFVKSPTKIHSLFIRFRWAEAQYMRPHVSSKHREIYSELPVSERNLLSTNSLTG